MKVADIALSCENFKEANWEMIIEQCSSRNCEFYSSEFFQAATAAKDEAKTIGDVYTFLGHITSPMLKSESDSEPFSPCFIRPDGYRSTIPQDFSDLQLDLLTEIAPTVRDPELQARITDVIWERKRDFRIAQIAVRAYLDSAQYLENTEGKNWTWTFSRIQRALHIAVRLGKNNESFKVAIDYIESLLAKCQAENSGYFSAKLMRLLQEQRLGDFAKYAEFSEQAATCAEQSGKWDMARDYLEVAGRWYALLKDVENQRQVRVRIAETYVNESNIAISSSPPSYMIAASCFQKAIESYRRVGGMKERIEELHKLLLEYQPLSMSEMKMFSNKEIDLSNFVEHTRAQVRGQSFKDAILKLTLMESSPKVEDLKKQVEKEIRNYPLPFLIAKTLYNETGKIIEHKPSIISNDAETSAIALEVSMIENARRIQDIYVSGFIDPVRYQINLEHNISVNDFAFIVVDNPFIPPNRELIYARGLLAGLRGDFLISTHLLVPQIEHSIRYLMEQRGFIVSGLDDRGIQDEHNINVLIRRPELVEILGEDIVFDLKGLLVQRFGSNLRNRMAHGLMGHNSFYTYDNSYLWWLILRLCCLPMIQCSVFQENGG